MTLKEKKTHGIECGKRSECSEAVIDEKSVLCSVRSDSERLMVVRSSWLVLLL